MTADGRATRRAGDRGSGPSRAEWMLAAAALVALLLGWRLFWFQCDDAYIAFRYVSNSVAGWGYVWNPPPFLPVEGYTSFLWIALLDGVWRITGVEPPVAANWISLLAGSLSLFLVACMFTRMALPEAADRRRTLFLAVAILGIVSNRTFLAWLSSGLETSLFNLCLTAWIFVGTTPDAGRGRRWLTWLSLFAALSALTRPDGLLFVAASGLIGLRQLLTTSGRSASDVRATLLGLAPLLVIVLHLIWRFTSYGSWLPNTYYAKNVAAWPESGIRYLASFVLEYGLWLWLLLFVVWAGEGLLRRRGEIRAALVAADPFWITIAALVGQLAYYTLVIGGDHFEYRIYSYLVPLLFLSAAWLATHVSRDWRMSLALTISLMLLSWPIPWVHWWQTHDLETRRETQLLVVPIAQHFPAPVRPIVEAWDDLQDWMIRRFVGVRHQEHKVFAEHMKRSLPTRDETRELVWEDRNVTVAGAVGVLGWVLPGVAIIDRHGLNDPVIAHSSRSVRKGMRFMAHERRPPEHYTECFDPNVEIVDGRVKRRERPLSDAQIEACQRIGG